MGHVGQVTEAYIARELRTPLHLEIAANCKTGVFTTLYGANMLFKGRNPDGRAADYLVIDTDENVTLDGPGASTYGSAMHQFQALCPNRMR